MSVFNIYIHVFVTYHLMLYPLFFITGGGGTPGSMEALSLADIFAVVVTNPRGRADPQGTQFIIHALKSKPGSCGDLMEITCQPLDPHPAATSQTWGEYLSQQIQSMRQREREYELHLYILNV